MNLPIHDPAVLASYQTIRARHPRRRFVPALTATAAWAIILVVLLASGPVPVPFIAFFVLSVLYMWYAQFFGVYRVELTSGTLRWRSLVRSGEVPLTEVRRIRLRRFGRVSYAIIEHDRGRPIRIATREGFGKFADDVRRAAPHADVSIPPPATDVGYQRYD